MKKTALTLILAIVAVCAASAQKFAMVDMEYILRNVPSYEMANEQLNQLSLRWQREEAIVAKEKEATDLRFKYFGPEGELYKKRQSLLKPIQDEVYNAIKKVAQQRGYQTVFDRASSSEIIYASPTIDISNEILNSLGYSK